MSTPEPGPARPRLATNTLWALSGNVLRAGLLAAYVVLTARVLGAEQYGLFISIVALVGVLSGFAAFGTGQLLVQNISRDPARLTHYWGRSLGVVVVSGGALTVLLLAASPWAVPSTVPATLVLALALSDLVMTPIQIGCAQIFQARERLSAMISLYVLMAGLRLLAVVAMSFVIAAPTANDQAWFYFSASATATLISAGYVARQFGRPRWTRQGLPQDLRQGAYYSFSSVAQYALANLDKVLLARLASPAIAAIYSVAQRAAEVALIPVLALMAASMPRFFQEGQHGVARSFALARRLLPLLLGYAVVAGAVVYGIAPWLPRLVGPDYERTATALRWLAPLPLLWMLNGLAGDATAGAGRQRSRTAVEVLSVILNVALNAWLVPQHSFYGSIWALLLSFSFGATVLWFMGLRAQDRSQER